MATSLLYTDVSSKRIKYITLNQWFDESLLKENSLHPIYFPSVNKSNYELFMNDFKYAYGLDGDQLSFLSYDLIGLVYFLIYENNFNISKKIFYKKNKFKGKIGIFEINKNTITSTTSMALRIISLKKFLIFLNAIERWSIAYFLLGSISLKLIFFL